MEPFVILALSVLLFSGASQFAFAGILFTGGSMVLAVLTAAVLNLRFAFMAASVAPRLRLSGVSRVAGAHFVIEAPVALALSAAGEHATRTFLRTGAGLYGAWILGTGIGVALSTVSSFQPERFGLDAALPAVLIAVLLPQSRDLLSAITALAAAAAMMLLGGRLVGGLAETTAAICAVSMAMLVRRRRPGSWRRS